MSNNPRRHLSALWQLSTAMLCPIKIGEYSKSSMMFFFFLWPMVTDENSHQLSMQYTNQLPNNNACGHAILINTPIINYPQVMTNFSWPMMGCEKHMGHLWWRRVANLQTSSVTSDKATCEGGPQRAELHGSTSANLYCDFSLQLQEWHLTSLRNPQHHLGRLMLVAHIPILLGQRPFSTDWPLIFARQK